MYFFFENKNFHPTLTGYNFENFLLSEDFSLMSYVNVCYNNKQKRICYKLFRIIIGILILNSLNNLIKLSRMYSSTGRAVGF